MRGFVQLVLGADVDQLLTDAAEDLECFFTLTRYFALQLNGIVHLAGRVAFDQIHCDLPDLFIVLADALLDHLAADDLVCEAILGLEFDRTDF